MQTPDNLKTRLGEEAFNDDGLVQRSIRLLKDKYPDLEVCSSSCAREQQLLTQRVRLTCAV